jgi:GrpB-like predicted nucleotidyltransferase (UPF0157 family)
VTGGLEENEGLEDAARRELWEETGITPTALHAVGFSYSFPIMDEWKRYYPAGSSEITEHTFVATAQEQAEPRLSAEHEAWRWCAIEQAIALLRYPNNIEALQRCNESLLGWQALILTPYDPNWQREFDDLRRVLQAALAPLAAAVHHVGSTAIPDLVAKPVLDIDVEIADYSLFPTVVERLTGLGYEYRGEQGIADRHAFRQVDQSVPRCSPHREWTAQHLYVCPSFSKELERHLLFRDYLRQHPEARREYGDIKMAVAGKSNRDRKLYASLKEIEARAFVERVIETARA